MQTERTLSVETLSAQELNAYCARLCEEAGVSFKGVQSSFNLPGLSTCLLADNRYSSTFAVPIDSDLSVERIRRVYMESNVRFRQASRGVIRRKEA